MKKLKLGRTLVLIGVLFWVIENMYFGWNKSPMSELEEKSDLIVRFLVNIGFFIYILPIYSLYENAVKNSEKNNDENKVEQ